MDTTFGERLKALRNEKHLTGEELGKLLNVTKVAVSKWETNDRFPDKDILIKLADIFNVTLDYLLCRTNIRDAAVYENNINGKPVHIEYKERSYVGGLTYEQVNKILKGLDEAGLLKKQK